LSDPLGEVIVVKEPQPKSFVEPALSAAMHCCVKPTWFQEGTMIDARPRIRVVLMMMPRERIGSSR
jgi:hypothetical protein